MPRRARAREVSAANRIIAALRGWFTRQLYTMARRQRRLQLYFGAYFGGPTQSRPLNELRFRNNARTDQYRQRGLVGAMHMPEDEGRPVDPMSEYSDGERVLRVRYRGLRWMG